MPKVLTATYLLALFFLFTNSSIAQTDSIIYIRQQDNVDNIKTWSKKDLFVNSIVPLKEYEGVSSPFTIDIRAFQHSFAMESQLPKTWVLGYVHADTKRGEEALPGPFLEVKYNQPINIKWVNKLKETIIDNVKYPKFVFTKCAGGDSCKCDKTPKKYYPIIYNVNDPNHIPMFVHALYDTTKMSGATEGASYYGTTVHLHGANVTWLNDGYPNSKYLKKAGDSISKTLPIYAEMNWGVFGPFEKQNFTSYAYGNTFPEGNFDPNSGKVDNTIGNHGAILWYHDHTMMKTVTNVYAGLVGTYIIEGEAEEMAFENHHLGKIPDVPLLITDKMFTKNGFLYFNTTQHDPVTQDGGQPEFLGNAIVVNGKVWPNMEVGKGVYRLRILNTSSSRYYNIGLLRKLKADSLFTKLPNNLNDSIFTQIGTESGLMPRYRQITSTDSTNSLILAPGERADVLLNFSEIPNDYDKIILANFALNEPYGNDTMLSTNDIMNLIQKDTLTNLIMSFAINDTIKKVNRYEISYMTNLALKDRLALLQKDPICTKMTCNISLNDSTNTRNLLSKNVFTVTLVEANSLKELPINYQNFIGKDSTELSFPMVLMNEGDWNSEAHGYSPIKNTINEDIETWVIDNRTQDTHPIHLHLNRFRVIKRVYDNGNVEDIQKIVNTQGSHEEYGWKDVVKAKPNCKTYIQVQYLLNKAEGWEGNFLYHCHLLEHEDMSMMRRLIVQPKIR